MDSFLKKKSATVAGDAIIKNINTGNNLYLGTGPNAALGINMTAVNAFLPVDITYAASSALNVLSGASGSNGFMTIGRTAGEAEFGVVAANNNFLTGTIPGDTVIIDTNSGSTLWFGIGTSPIAYINGSGIHRQW